MQHRRCSRNPSQIPRRHCQCDNGVNAVTKICKPSSC
jgi:hypothetical protein